MKNIGLLSLTYFIITSLLFLSPNTVPKANAQSDNWAKLHVTLRDSNWTPYMDAKYTHACGPNKFESVVVSAKVIDGDQEINPNYGTDRACFSQKPQLMFVHRTDENTLHWKVEVATNGNYACEWEYKADWEHGEVLEGGNGCIIELTDVPTNDRPAVDVFLTPITSTPTPTPTANQTTTPSPSQTPPQALLEVYPSGQCEGRQYCGGDGIQQAIDDVPAGGIVLVKRGTYNNRTRNIKSCYIEDVGNSTFFTTNCKRGADFTLNFEPGVVIDGSGEQTLKGILWQGNGTTLTLNGITVKNFKEHNVYAYKGAKMNVVNSHIIGSKTGPGVLYSKNALGNVSTSTIANNNRVGIVYNNNSHGRVSTSTIINNGQDSNWKGAVYAGEGSSVTVDKVITAKNGQVLQCHNGNEIQVNSLLSLENEPLGNCQADASKVIRKDTPLNQVLKTNLHFKPDACNVLSGNERQALAWGAYPENPDTFCGGGNATPTLSPNLANWNNNGLVNWTNDYFNHRNEHVSELDLNGDQRLDLVDYQIWWNHTQ